MSASAAPAPDTARCPLCHQPNTCAITAGQPAQDCWCMSAPVSRAALQRVPAGLRGRACLCPQCARENPAAVDKMAALETDAAPLLPASSP